jgi:hypothetical protein
MPDKTLAARSLFAIPRIASLQEPLSHLRTRKNPEALYLGEDRTTRGNWQASSYGTYFSILCAMAGYDIMGGEQQAQFREPVHATEGIYVRKYRVYTGNPSDPARGWISKSGTTSPGFLINPLKKTPVPSNWDDHGEEYLLGKGPDLFFEIQVPEEGQFLLSLYFINDPCYYEPNRHYTVYLRDKETDTIVAGTEVNDFYSGVYKKFIIPGNKAITVQICRNLSINTLLSGVFIDPAQQLPQEKKPANPVKGKDTR